MISDWIANNYIELFGAITGIIYVILEIRQIIWLWPLGILTSGIYIWVFFSTKFYADMSLQVYYLVISVLGWYWWLKGSELRAQGTRQNNSPFEGGRALKNHAVRDFSEGASLQGSQSGGGGGDVLIKTEDRRPETEANWSRGDVRLKVTRLKFRTGIILGIAFFILFLILWYVLSHFTDSPVPKWDSFLTSLSIIATWMLARKILEHWYLWIVVNSVSSFVFYIKGLYPTVGLYIIYLAMSFVGLREWLRTIREGSSQSS